MEWYFALQFGGICDFLVRCTRLENKALLTVHLSKTTIITKFSWKNPQSIVFDYTAPSSIVNTDINLRGASVECVLDQFAYHTIEADNGNRGLDLCNDIWR